jgi:hypothetical protein
MTDKEMDKIEAEFRAVINAKTAERRKEAELNNSTGKMQFKAAIKEICKESMWDRVWAYLALAMFVVALFCSEKAGLISMVLRIPITAICAIIACYCVFDIFRIRKLIKDI